MSSAPRLAKPRPSGRNAYEFSAIFWVGYFELSTMISIAVLVIATAFLKASMSNSTSAPPEAEGANRWNLRRFSDARLHAESSRNMYSEHGFDALIGAVFFDVCHRLIVVSYCIPGSPQM